ncbi:nuclear transport factor 2 family protein [Aggregatilinea lenta]|uniref:nuclear transport factor 2 family protein n=1 Tax=Aggregatilinea lenta TaxID=913108 RepID=UPI00350E354F
MDRWTTAVLSGEMEKLDQMSIPGFVTIGPRGFVLNKQQWLGSFQSGDLEYDSLK